MAVDFRKMRERGMQLCAECLAPWKEHKWVRDGDDWSMSSGGARLVDVGGRSFMHCPKFVEGPPLAGVDLAVTTLERYLTATDGVSQLLEDFGDVDFQWSDFVKAAAEMGIADELASSKALRERCVKELIQQPRMVLEKFPDMPEIVADNIIAEFAQRISGQDETKAIRLCSEFLVTTLKTNLHFFIGRGDMIGTHVLMLERVLGVIIRRFEEE